MSAAELFLWPVSVAWLAVVKLRALGYRSGIFRRGRLKGIAISVGNLTAGGTGKTPMVLWLMERLAADGVRTGVLTRGYAGFMRGKKKTECDIVLSAENSPAGLPDEVSLMMQRLQRRPAAGPAAWFGVGADRERLGRELERRGVEYFVLDDGFQHLQLARDVDIVLIDAENPFGNGLLLPAGRLREPRSALKRADIVVVTRSDNAPALESMIRRHTTAPIFHAAVSLDAIRRASAAREELPPDKYSAQKCFVFCGIGNPRAFFTDAKRWGLPLCGEHSFPDHHRYSQSEFDALDAEAVRAGATALLCTEKDACNLRGVVFRQLQVFYAEISMQFPNADEFWRIVVDIAKRSRAGAAR